MRKITQIQLLREFSENATKKIIDKFSNDASEEEIRRELKDFEKYKNGIQLKDPFQYKTWLDFTQAIHGAKGKSEFKNRNLKDKGKPKTFVNKSEESSEAIVDDENVTIFKGDEEHKCVKYGKGYSFCISRPGGGNMFGNYRLQKSSTFYFIFFKKVPKSDPKHIMVLDRTEHGWEWTFADNNTQEIEGDFDEVVENFPALEKYESIFENNPLTDKEKYELNEIRAFAGYQNLQKFNSYDYSLKDRIVKSGITLEDEIFKSLNNSLRNEYISTGNNLTKYQQDDLEIPEIKRYLKVRLLTIDSLLLDANNYLILGSYNPGKFDSLTGNKHIIDAYDTGQVKEIELFDGTHIYLHKNGNKKTLYKSKDYWHDYYPNGMIEKSLVHNDYNEYYENGNLSYSKDRAGNESWYGKDRKLQKRKLKNESLNINIKKYTQADLISEGFWDSFKKPLGFAGRVVKGAATIGKFAAETLAPELTNPIKSVVGGIKDLNQRVIKATTPEITYITNKLSNQGYSIIGNDISKIKMMPGDDKQLYKARVKLSQNFIAVGDPNPEKIFLLDREGNIVRDLSAKNAARSGTRPQRQRTQQAPTPPTQRQNP